MELELDDEKEILNEIESKKQTKSLKGLLNKPKLSKFELDEFMSE